MIRTASMHPEILSLSPFNSKKKCPRTRITLHGPHQPNPFNDPYFASEVLKRSLQSDNWLKLCRYFCYGSLFVVSEFWRQPLPHPCTCCQIQPEINPLQEFAMLCCGIYFSLRMFSTVYFNA